jgi:hypothetical protein
MATLPAALASNCVELSERKKSDIEDQLTAETSAEFFFAARLFALVLSSTYTTLTPSSKRSSKQTTE